MHEQGSEKMGLFGADLWKGLSAKGKGTFRQGEQSVPPDHEKCWIAEESELLVHLDSLLGSFMVSGKGCLPVLRVHTSLEMYLY